VPVFSFAWGLGKIAAPLTGSGDVKLFGFRIPLPTNTIFVASARYLGWLSRRVVLSRRAEPARQAGRLA
jgi:hypothetical protein